MSQYSNIMVIVDPKMRHSTAFARGVELAEKSGAALTLLLVDYNPALFRARFLDPEILHKAIRGYLSVRRRWMETEVAKLQEKGIKASGEVVWHKPPYEEIARQAMERNPDIIIKDIAPVSRLKRAIFTPEDWHLMRLCPAPLMLVNEHSSTYPQKILSAVDPFDTHGKPSKLNDAVINAGLAMAYQCDSDIHVVHAYEFMPAAAPVGAETVFADAKIFDDIKEDHRQAFLKFAEQRSIPAEQMHLLEGAPTEVIPDLAERMNADLVVLGTVHRTGLRRALMGSTAESLIGNIECDVLVVKPEGFVQDLRIELESIAKDHELPDPWKDFRRFSL